MEYFLKVFFSLISPISEKKKKKKKRKNVINLNFND